MDYFDSIGVYGDAPALVSDKGEIVTYSDLTKAADVIGAALSERCLVLCVCSNNVESVVGYIGCLRHKAVPLLVNQGLDANMLNGLMKAYNPFYIFASLRMAEKYEDWQLILKFREYALFKTPFRHACSIHDDLALLLTTSGSTGSRKFVRQSFNNIISNATAIAKYLRITASDRPITTMPMSYTYGLSIINSHLLMGASILLTDKTFFDKEFWRFFKSHGATTFGGVPYTYKMLQKLQFRRMDLPSLKVLTQAGGRLDPTLAMEFAEVCNKKGVQFVVMYGQTEATARISYLPPEYAIRKAGSVGVVIPGGELVLMDESGGIIADSDVIGELVYKGPNVTLGYAETDSDLAKGDENDGILKTGDMAKRDADGFYYIVGRKKRFLKLFGNRVNIDELENILKSAGFECACTGIDDSMVVFTCSDDDAAIRDYLVANTMLNLNGVTIKKVAVFPRSESGKIIYSALN
jgi:acyl-coenzyme A synthetase/AMP-(fatty) acid ligase